MNWGKQNIHTEKENKRLKRLAIFRKCLFLPPANNWILSHPYQWIKYEYLRRSSSRKSKRKIT